MFGKIFEQIYDSSIAEDWTVRLVFTDFIVLADLNGVVDRTPEAIARRTNVPLEIVLKAIKALEAPDGKSRNPIAGGARIRRLDEHRNWGWQIVNYQHYREIASAEQRRARTKERVRKLRSDNNLESCNAAVTQCNACNAMQKQKQKQKQKQRDQDLCIKGESKPKRKGVDPQIQSVLDFLNALTGRSFREPGHLADRLQESGVSLEGIKLMIERQCKKWKGGEMEEFLRPETLFRKGKFDGYYSAKDLPLPTPGPNQIYGQQQRTPNGSHRPNSAAGFDRAAGTLNAGTSQRYNIKAIEAARAFRDARQAGAGALPGSNGKLRGLP